MTHGRKYKAEVMAGRLSFFCWDRARRCKQGTYLDGELKLLEATLTQRTIGHQRPSPGGEKQPAKCRGQPTLVVGMERKELPSFFLFSISIVFILFSLVYLFSSCFLFIFVLLLFSLPSFFLFLNSVFLFFSFVLFF